MQLAMLTYYKRNGSAFYFILKVFMNGKVIVYSISANTHHLSNNENDLKKEHLPTKP